MAEESIVSDITVRKAEISDLLAISEFIKPFVESGKLLPRTFKELAELMGTCFIAVEDDSAEIVGCAALEIYSRKLAEIRSLAVSSTVQGRGVGKRLVIACVELAKERDIYEIMAISSSEDFFKACGFDFTLPKERKAFFLQTRDEL